MLKKEDITIQGRAFEVSFQFKQSEAGINHIIAKTVVNGKQISSDDHGLGKNSALSKLRSQLLQEMKKAA